MIEFTAGQLIAHAVGDYLIQSDWMAAEKRKSAQACLLHALSYTLPFVFCTQSWLALLFIATSHYLIDSLALARYLVYAKNLAAPAKYRYAWKDCEATGYHKDRPVWLAVWLYIIADNILHVLCNGFAVTFL